MPEKGSPMVESRLPAGRKREANWARRQISALPCMAEFRFQVPTAPGRVGSREEQEAVQGKRGKTKNKNPASFKRKGHGLSVLPGEGPGALKSPSVFPVIMQHISSNGADHDYDDNVSSYRNDRSEAF